VKRHIPNLFTLANLLCGTMAIITVLENPEHMRVAAYYIVVGAFFDVLDGLVARMLKVSGEMGKQLDSLADMVTFGVAPALIARELFLVSLLQHNGSMDFSLVEKMLAYLPFMLIAFSALRLAKFNIDARQTSEFIGLPTPANALFWIAIPFIVGHKYVQTGGEGLSKLIMNHWVLAGLCILLSLLMVSEIRLMSLKVSSFGLKGNEWRIVLLICAAVLVVFLGMGALPFIILLYILLSLIKNRLSSEVQS